MIHSWIHSGCIDSSFSLQPSMMKVFLHNVLAVGMRHYGHSSLEVGKGYHLRRDDNNPHDPNAVSVVCRITGIKEASIKRDHAAIIAALYDAGLVKRHRLVLKPKNRPTFHSPRIGMAQKCTVGFYIEYRDRQEVQHYLSSHSLNFQILWKHIYVWKY